MIADPLALQFILNNPNFVYAPTKEFHILTQMQAKIKNSSEFVFLPGDASVYVDGSFISRTKVPSVSPEETFECPLG